jgi:hypothetical protein
MDLETEGGRWINVIPHREPGHADARGDEPHYDPPHACALPQEVGDAATGSVWFCETCGRRYKLNRNDFGISWMNA